MRDATEKDKEYISSRLNDFTMMPKGIGAYYLFNKLFDHQIPENVKEWETNLCNIKIRLDELEEEKDRLKKEYEAQSYIGIALYYDFEDENANTEDTYEDTDNQAV